MHCLLGIIIHNVLCNVQDNAPRPNEADPWESDEEVDMEGDDEEEDSAPVDQPPQSSQGDQLREHLEQAFTTLRWAPCCRRKCLQGIIFEDLYQQVLELRSQSATHREALIMGLLMARRY